MARYKMLNRITRVADMGLEDFYDKREVADEWKLKSRRLEAKRWRQLKHQLV